MSFTYMSILWWGVWRYSIVVSYFDYYVLWWVLQVPLRSFFTFCSQGYWLCVQIRNSSSIKRSRQFKKLSSIHTAQSNTFLWLIYYRFAQGLRLRQVDMMQEGITNSSATLTKLTDKLRRVCKAAMKRMRRRGKQTIGRRGELVLIDESKFGHKRKVGYADHLHQNIAALSNKYWPVCYFYVI